MNELTGRPALPLSGSDNGVLIKDADGLRIFASSRPDEEARRDVAFIVATVNGHDMLCRRVWEAETKLAAVPQYVFWCLNARERGEMIIPSLSEWLGGPREMASFPPFSAEDGLIDDVMRQGYAIWIRPMVRVRFGVILRRAGRYGAKAIAVYGAGDTLAAAIERALSKAERKQVQP